MMVVISTSFWGMELWNRRYSPTACRRFISSGLRSRGMNGPVGPAAPRGVATSSSTAFFWAGVSLSAGIAGIRSCASAAAGKISNRKALEQKFMGGV
jgi:hypothetical protein